MPNSAAGCTSLRREGDRSLANGGEFLNAKGVLAPNVRPYVMTLKLTVSRLNSGAFGTDFKTAYAVKA